MPEILEDFYISYKKKGGKHLLIVTPATPCQYGEKEIEITYEQWEELKFHFVTGITNSAITKLVYVK